MIEKRQHMHTRFLQATTTLLAVLAVVLVRGYRVVDNLLVGSPVWQRSPVRSAVALQRRVRMLSGGKLVTE
ncbi:hypothetical protein RKD45_001428 [Streptomyces griseus]